MFEVGRKRGTPLDNPFDAEGKADLRDDLTVVEDKSRTPMNVTGHLLSDELDKAGQT